VAFDNRVMAVGNIVRGGVLGIIGPRSGSLLLSCELNFAVDINFEN
jgi:hypothetical protein